MTWNWRVVEKTVGDHKEVGIYSVYYDSQGHVDGVSLEPHRVTGYSVEGLGETLQLMEECLAEPVLLWEEIAGEE